MLDSMVRIPHQVLYSNSSTTGVLCQVPGTYAWSARIRLDEGTSGKAWRGLDASKQSISPKRCSDKLIQIYARAAE